MKNDSPNRDESIDAIIIAIIEVLTILFSENARFDKKIAIVKPIPASNPAPKICLNVRLLNIWHILNLMARNENNVIPSGFPTTSPRIIPILFTIKI